MILLVSQKCSMCNVSIVELVVTSQPAVKIVSFSGHEWDQYLMSGDLPGLFLAECDPQMQVAMDLSSQKVMKHLSQLMHPSMDSWCTCPLYRQ